VKSPALLLRAAHLLQALAGVGGDRLVSSKPRNRQLGDGEGSGSKLYQRSDRLNSHLLALRASRCQLARMKNCAMTLLLAGLFFAAPAARAGASVTSNAEGRAQPLMLTLNPGSLTLPDQGFRYQRERSAGSVIASDALYGGLIGLILGAGVALISNDFSNGGWGRDLAVGAGVGLIAGGIFGAVNVVSVSDRTLAESDRSRRDRGLGAAAGARTAF